MMAKGPVLDDRALNRATLSRQLLLDRSARPVAETVEHLVGLQAQNPLDPYLALWSRLERFEPTELGRMLENRSVVRIVVMRGTVHLVSADDALTLRPLTQPVMDAEIARHSQFAPHLVDVDMEPVLAHARTVLAEQPLTTTQLRAALAERFPGLDPAALAYACRCLLPLVQVPPRGVWGRTSQVVLTTTESWLGRPLSTSPSIDDVLLRYLAAFGPSTVSDMARWSRLTGLAEVVSRIRHRLTVFRDVRGRELFDLPGAPRPHPDIPAPVRFLPEYDNALLSHADRSRFGAADGLVVSVDRPFKGSVLVDGEVRAIWHFARQGTKKAAERVDLVVDHLRLTGPDLAAVEAEADDLLRFWHADVAERSVQLRPFDRS